MQHPRSGIGYSSRLSFNPGLITGHRLVENSVKGDAFEFMDYR
jgi:hypothetical protein